jgi:hypothetical protein
MEKAEESGEEGENIDEEELERQARQDADKLFHEHFRLPLMKFPHPPKAVLALFESETLCRTFLLLLNDTTAHKSTPTDSRLAELISETMKALEKSPSLELLFITAQNADVLAKLEWSLVCVSFHRNCTFKPNRICYLRAFWVHSAGLAGTKVSSWLVISSYSSFSLPLENTFHPDFTRTSTIIRNALVSVWNISWSSKLKTGSLPFPLYIKDC